MGQAGGGEGVAKCLDLHLSDRERIAETAKFPLAECPEPR
jgi:hypothetical protein